MESKRDKKTQSIYKSYPPSNVVDAAVLWWCFYFCIFKIRTYRNKIQTTTKLKVSREWKEQKNGGNNHHKYAIRWSNGTYPLLLLLMLLFFVLCLLQPMILRGETTTKYLTKIKILCSIKNGRIYMVTKYKY